MKRELRRSSLMEILIFKPMRGLPGSGRPLVNVERLAGLSKAGKHCRWWLKTRLYVSMCHRYFQAYVSAESQERWWLIALHSLRVLANLMSEIWSKAWTKAAGSQESRLIAVEEYMERPSLWFKAIYYGDWLIVELLAAIAHILAALNQTIVARISSVSRDVVHSSFL
jgi:hypothetical protein